MNAGVAKRDISPPVGANLGAHTRHSSGNHDPLYVKAVVLDDGERSVAIVCMDVAATDFVFTDDLRERIKTSTGIETSLVNISHTHSAPFAMANTSMLENPSAAEEQWLVDVKLSAVKAVEEADAGKSPALLYSGRAPVQVGYNRRLPSDDGMYMDINLEGPVVPWVDTLEIRRPDTGTAAVLFEHAAHPVIAHDASSLTGGDYPAFACERITEKLGSSVLPAFAQGCGADVNGHPLATGHENAAIAGRKLGDAAVLAVKDGVLIAADRLSVVSRRLSLPCMTVADREYHGTRKGETSEVTSLRFDFTVVGIGSRWGIVAMSHEVLSEYQLWLDETAPFDRTMVLGYTNACQSYIATDEILLMEDGGYEAGRFLGCWMAVEEDRTRLPLKPGAEKIIKAGITAAWTEMGASRF